MKGFIAWMCLIVMVSAWGAVYGIAQAPGVMAPPVVAKPKPSPEMQAKILRLELDATRLQNQFQSCKSTDFQGQYNQVGLQMQAVGDAALAEAKLDKKEWELDFDTLEFKKRTTPLPPSPAPAAEVKVVPPESKKP